MRIHIPGPVMAALRNCIPAQFLDAGVETTAARYQGRAAGRSGQFGDLDGLPERVLTDGEGTAGSTGTRSSN